MLTEPEVAPLPDGVKLGVMVHELPLNSVLPHVVVTPKAAPLGVMLAILSVALPVFVSVTVGQDPVNPTLTLPQAEELELRLTTGAGAAVPVPDKDIWCGLPDALSVMVTVPVMAPVPAGVKVGVITQELPAFKVDPQLLPTPNWLLAVMLEIDKGPVPVFVRVTVEQFTCAPTVELPQPEDPLLRLTTGTAATTPVPDNATLCGLPVALSVKTRESVLAPVDVGVNVRPTVQLEPMPRVDEHVLELTEYCVPVCSAIEVIDTDSEPVLVSVTVLGADGVLIVWLPKLIDVGLRLTVGVTGAPA